MIWTCVVEHCSEAKYLQMVTDDLTRRELLRSLDGQHLKARHDFEKDGGISGLYTSQRLQLHRNSMSVLVIHSFLGFKPTGTEVDEASNLAHGPIRCLMRMDAWFGTTLNCLTEKKTRRGHQQKMCADEYVKLLLMATEKLTGNVCALVEYKSEEKLESRLDRNVLKVVQTPSKRKKIQEEHREGFQQF